jgi:competence protein ComEC
LAIPASGPDPAPVKAARGGDWFYRRPLAWLALSTAAGIALGYHTGWPWYGWLVVAGGGAALAVIFRALGLLLLALGLAAAVTPSRGLPLEAPGLREGDPVTIQGTVLRSFGAEGATALIQAEWRLTTAGWRPFRTRLGAQGLPSSAPGDQLRLSGVLREPQPPTNPGGVERRLRWQVRGARLVLDLRHEGYTLIGRSRPGWLREAAAAVRARILHSNRATLSPRAAIIANELLLGDRSPPDPALAGQVHSAFRDAGLLHLLVVSGAQVSLVAGLFLWLGWRFFTARLAWWSLGALSVGAYWILTDGDPSVSRAAVTGAAAALALLLQREPDGENTLGFAALVLFILNPLTLFDIGFQLSFAAVWSLLRLAPAVYAAISPKWLPADVRTGYQALRTAYSILAGVLSTCVAAQLAVAPLLAFHFQRSSWAGLLANIPAAFSAVLLLPLAAGHAALSALGIHLLAVPIDWLSGQLYGLADLFAREPFSAAGVFPPPLWLLPACALLLLAPSLRGHSRLKTAACVLTLAGVILTSERLPAAPPRVPTLRMVDVGQGDAILLQDPAGSAVLIDGGPPEAADDILRALRALRILALDVVVATHADADHIGGLSAVLDSMPVGAFAHRVAEGGPLWLELLKTARHRRVPVLTPSAGDRLSLGGSGLTVLGPLAQGPQSDNAGSLVLRWDTSGGRVLLTGDAGLEAEAALEPWGADLRAEVLKVGHHGSADATGAAWLEAVRPRLALISCGRNNRFGHPSPATLHRLEAAGIPVLRTDRGGMLTVELSAGRFAARRFTDPAH